ncbi:acyl-CoA thioesterase [Pseudomonas sp. GD03860]|uniref:acyl-CoA thioesterase n=1 Tax=Pseudomonas TaxID=286 RepID=UPI002363E110|nr:MULTISPECIES: thioesterase family protein [Pseudomonas]MDD2058535.1 acyl-CoA thioesterase [Pseudomonas putida]MDH0640717.1 acyl-CoA thioesterase [Pseudomonas sp. GD03860]
MRPTREAFRRFYPITTRWGDHDSYGHVNNVVYHSYYESAISQFLVEEGTLDIGSSPVIGLIAENCCSYFASISFPDRVTIGVKVAHLGNSSLRYELGLFRNDEQQASAAGYIVYVYVDRVSNRSVPIPQAVRTVLATLADQ